MQECGPHEPWHQRSVFDRIPAPVPTPTQDRIRPVRAQENPDRQEAPGHHRPAASDVDPFLAGIAHNQRAQRERERHGKSDVTQIEHGRMDDHLGILQERIQAAAVGRDLAFENGERMGGDIQEQQEENLHGRDYDRRVSKKAWIGFVSQTENEPVGRQQQGPEQQRAFLTGPQNGEFVGSGKILIAVMKDVGDREIVGKGGGDEYDGSEQDGAERGDAGAARGFPEAFGSGPANDQRDRADDEGIGRKAERQQERKTTDLRQCHITELGHGGTFAYFFRNGALEQPRRPW